jgi:uncharacterized protein
MGSGSSLACDVSLNSILPPHLRDAYQNTSMIRRILSDSKTIAMVGLSSDSQRPSYFVASYLKYEGYRIIPVNPNAKEILGEKVYPDVRSIPDTIDVVNVFRRPNECDDIVKQAIEKRARAVWFQLRIVNEEAAKAAMDAGLAVVMDKCVKMEHGRYNGSLHWVGMNTEILTAQKSRRLF